MPGAFRDSRSQFEDAERLEHRLDDRPEDVAHAGDVSRYSAVWRYDLNIESNREFMDDTDAVDSPHDHRMPTEGLSAAVVHDPDDESAPGLDRHRLNRRGSAGTASRDLSECHGVRPWRPDRASDFDVLTGNDGDLSRRETGKELLGHKWQRERCAEGE